jgi:putative tryptophan/tyrosine transport system substrate-binding protein
MPNIGILDSASPEARGEELDAFYSGLAKAGIDGKDTVILYSWANNDYTRLPALARKLVSSKASVIVAAGGPVSAIAAKQVAKKTPIVFTTITDPEASGLVADLRKPGGNLTGTHGFTTELDDERLQAMSDLVGDGTIGILANPNRPYPTKPDFARQKSDLQAKAKKAGRSAIILDLSSARQVNGALKKLGGKVVGLVPAADPFFNSCRKEVVKLAADLKVPAIYQWRGFVEAGGLMSYGPSKAEGYRNAGELAGLILKGKHPKGLAVRQTKDFELVVNSKTAESLGVDIEGPEFSRMVEGLKNPKVTVV